MDLSIGASARTGPRARPRSASRGNHTGVTRFRAAGLLVAALVVHASPLLAVDLDAFARCLSRAGTTYYRTSWCPHCRAQEEMFGSAMRYIEEVDCTAPGSCAAAGVASFPTWIFGDGSRLSGFAQSA